MAISEADLGGRGWYSVRLRILDEQPECGKSMVVRKRDMGYELISLSGLFGSVSLPYPEIGSRDAQALRDVAMARSLGGSIRVSIGSWSVMPGA